MHEQEGMMHQHARREGQGHVHEHGGHEHMVEDRKKRFWISLIAAAALIVPLVQVQADFNVYGFAQLDYIQDFNRVDPDWQATLRSSKIPTTKGLFGSDGQAIVSATSEQTGR